MELKTWLLFGVFYVTANACDDKKQACPNWAKRGYCETNISVIKQCCKSCKKKGNTCDDKKQYCPNWAKGGHCQSNINVLKHCCKSCKKEANACDDKKPHCPSWAKRGYCQTTIGVIKDCCKSCMKEDVKECAKNNGGCDKHAVCIKASGSFTCQCKSGFITEGTACIDINECRINRARCTANAYCINTVGSYNCKCRSGFQEQGRSCIDINECRINRARCTANTYCINTVGSFNCKCKNGFKQQGRSCIDNCGVAPLRNVVALPSIGRIVAGSNAVIGHYPWQVAIYKKRAGAEADFHCGGTLIDNKHVISAAHCFNGVNKDEIIIVLGEHDRSTESESTTQTMQLHSIVVDANYNGGTFQNDIAILTLSSEAQFSDYVRPICLPSADEELQPGKICSVTGWGKEFLGGGKAQILQEIRVPVVGKTTCQERNRNREVTDKMICTGFNNGWSFHSACHGDSGGGLSCKSTQGIWKLYGVVSWGSPQCNALDSYNVFTKVSKYIRWIDEHRNTGREP